MKTSAAGRKALAQREGNKLTAYLDSVNVLTIGVGHTSRAGPPKVTKGMKITAAESDEILSRDLATFEKAVNDAVKVPLSQNEFDALVSLAFNIGGGAFKKSTLVRKLNAGDRSGAADAFRSWNKAGGKALKGLTTRREAERKQFLSGGKVTAPVKPVKPAPGEDPVYDSVQAIRNVQERLLALGYTEVGKPDGSLGNMTQAAILLFRQDNGLPLSAEIDDGLILALATAPQRKLVGARENATEKEVVDKVPEARPAWWLKITGFFGAIASLVVAAFDGIVGNIGAAKEYVQPIVGAFDSVPGWAWALLVGLVALGMWYAGRHGLQKSKEAFRDGSRR